MNYLIYHPFYSALILIVALQVYYLGFYFLRKTDVNKCPSCGNLHCDRVKRPFQVKIFLSYFPDFKYYKCPSCGNHFVIPLNTNKVVNEKSDSLKV